MFHRFISYYMPIAVATRSNAWVCGSSLTGISGPDPTGGLDVCLL